MGKENNILKYEPIVVSYFKKCVYQVLDALGKFGEHSLAYTYSSLMLSKLPTCIHNLIQLYALAKHKPILKYRGIVK